MNRTLIVGFIFFIKEIADGFFGGKGKKLRKKNVDSFSVMRGMERGKKSNILIMECWVSINYSVKINHVLCYLSLCGAFGSSFGIFAAVIRTYHRRPLEYIQVDRCINYFSRNEIIFCLLFLFGFTKFFL